MHPPATYVKLLDIKAIIRLWQDLDMNDAEALRLIKQIVENTK